MQALGYQVGSTSRSRSLRSRRFPFPVAGRFRSPYVCVTSWALREATDDALHIEGEARAGDGRDGGCGAGDDYLGAYRLQPHAVCLSCGSSLHRVAPDIVLAQGVSPQGDATLGKTATVETALQEAMGPYTVRVAVTSEADEASGTELLSLVAAPRRYHCEMTFEPWPQNIAIAGVALGSPLQLKHERTVVIDPWKPGVVL